MVGCTIPLHISAMSRLSVGPWPRRQDGVAQIDVLVRLTPAKWHIVCRLMLAAVANCVGANIAR